MYTYFYFCVYPLRIYTHREVDRGWDEFVGDVMYAYDKYNNNKIIILRILW